MNFWLVCGANSWGFFKRYHLLSYRQKKYFSNPKTTLTRLSYILKDCRYSLSVIREALKKTLLNKTKNYTVWVSLSLSKDAVLCI